MNQSHQRLNFNVFIFSAAVFIVCSVLWGMAHLRGPDFNLGSQIILPLFFYFAAHIMRAVRLWVLMGAGRARHLLWMYVYTAACSALIPFKMGEFVRINEIAFFKGSYWRGLLIVWIERVFDVVMIGLISLFILVVDKADQADIVVLLWLMGIFVFITIIVFFVLPEQLCSLNLYVIRNYQGKKSIAILKLLDSMYVLFQQVRPILSRKMVTLSLLTFFVWSAELVALFSLFGQMPWTSAFTALVQNFAAVLKGSSVVGSVNFPLLQVFEKLKIFSLMVLGIIFLFFYSKYRLRSAERKKR